jgi:hypothetical protein
MRVLSVFVDAFLSETAGAGNGLIGFFAMGFLAKSLASIDG